MIKIEGYYYDGCSSAQSEVVICFYESGVVQIRGDALDITTSMDQLKISTRLGNTRRNIFLSKGAKLETDDHEAVDQVCTWLNTSFFHTLIHRLEKNWSYALIALFTTIIFVWGSIEYGVPVAAKWAVKSIPASIEQKIGEQGLETLDNWLFSASTIDEIKQAQLQNLFKSLVTISESQYNYRLMLRSSKQMGANALALPGGIIIMTDALFELAENDEQLLAILAHEMGHVENRHGLRSLFQNSITALFMAGVLGDISSVTSLSVAIPTILVETRYSREFELEADQFAISTLKAKNIDVESLSRILTLLEQTHDQDTNIDFDYLSSHPAMNKRIDLIVEQLEQKKLTKRIVQD